MQNSPAYQEKLIAIARDSAQKLVGNMWNHLSVEIREALVMNAVMRSAYSADMSPENLYDIVHRLYHIIDVTGANVRPIN